MLAVMLLQSVYVYNIAQGKAGSFEENLLHNLALWMSEEGKKAKSKLWGIYLLAIVVDVLYFLLCHLVFVNSFFLSLTAFFIGVEFYRLFFLGLRMRQFFKSAIPLALMLDLRLERVSAIMFFTHALLGIVCLLWFNA